jgi:molecular chaperone GrpE
MSDTKPDPAATAQPADAETDAAPTPAMDEATDEPISELDELRAEVTSLKDQLLRALAENENTRRRAEREREDATKFAISNFARDMVGIADDLNRALDSLPEDQKSADGPLKTLVEGVEITRRNLGAAFNRQSISRIGPEGEKFDHNLHEAMFEVETPDKEPGTVVQVIQHGYKIHDRLLRPARVGVAKKPTPPTGIDTEV